MRVAVTGAAGFIGSHVTDAFLAGGHDVLGIDNLVTGRMANLGGALAAGRFRFVQQDITDPGVVEVIGAFEPELVCHLAASIDVRASVADPVEDARVNVLGTIRVLEAARLSAARRVVFVSSGGAIYGDTGDPATESSAVAPESPYGASKAAAELWLGVYRRLYGLEWTALALSNVYGPRQRPDGEGGVIAIFGSNVLVDRPVTIYGDGSQTRDFLYVGDVAAAVVLAAQAPADSAAAGHRVNLGTGIETSVLGLHDTIARICGSRRRPEFGPARSGEVVRSLIDASLAGVALGWAPAVALTLGLTRTLDWLRDTA
jgi:UDP-glucose 4-epimerase